jgi:hypothetical protein
MHQWDAKVMSRCRWNRKLRKDREGAAGAVATIFVILIILAFINIYISGFVYPEVRTQQYNHMQEAISQFSNLRLESYLISSSSWRYPVSTPITLGTPGVAPFSNPVQGNMNFSSLRGEISVQYQLGIPVLMPQCTVDFYENASGTAQHGIGNHTTFLPSPNGKIYGKQGNGGWIWYVPNGTVACLIINGNYINQDDYDVFIGANGPPPPPGGPGPGPGPGNPGGSGISNFTLLTYMYGNHNIIDFTGLGNNITAWYIVYGNYNTLSDQSNPCGFSFVGYNDKGYVQNYGQHNTGPSGWPAFATINQELNVTGSIQLSVYNTNYVPQTLYFQDGGIFLQQAGGSTVIKGPRISFQNTSNGAIVNFEMISLTGNSFTLSGSGTGDISEQLISNRTVTVGTYDGINLINDLNISISSQFASSWANFLSSKLSLLRNVTANPDIAINGQGCIDDSMMNHIDYGAYSLIVRNGVVYLNIYNVMQFTLNLGVIQIS